MSRQRRGSALLLIGALLIGAALTGLALAPGAEATSGSGQTFTKKVNRVFYSATGASTPADPKHPGGYTVKLSVSSTQNLRGNQPITVSWSGAHPTGGVVNDPNYGYDGSEQEYPFVLMECRGTAKTVTPETCWTQTAAERFQSANSATSAPVWRADGAAPSAERAAVVDAPRGTRPSGCAAQRFERWVPLKAASGRTYYGGGVGCYNLAPEGSDEPTTGVPDNTTYGITGTDGKGSAQFAVWTDEENATLGCSSRTACSLVAIPITGVDCDPYFTKVKAKDPIQPTSGQKSRYAASCEKADTYAPGQRADGSGDGFNLATSGRLWWSASNWADRIVVPLSFAVAGDSCALTNKTAPLLAYGSILMTDIAAQWQPTFCATKGYQPFLHVQATDAQARSLVSGGSVKVGFSSLPPDGGFGGTVAQAPIAVTGFAIAYNIDGADGRSVTDLKLDARLLAKLLSESYNGDLQGRTAYRALAGNPRTIFSDPEFHALNPGVDTSIPGVANSAAALISLSNDSDMLTALSSYIDADPEARRWLEGTPDPWGMVVNPHYRLTADDTGGAGASASAAATPTASEAPSAQPSASDEATDVSATASGEASADPSATATPTDGPSDVPSDGPTDGPSGSPSPGDGDPTGGGLSLPVSSWPLLDDFTLDGVGSNACLKGLPYLAQIAHPLSQIATIEESIEFALSNAQTTCPTVTDANDPSQLVPKTEGLQPIGHRFVIGIVPLTAVDRYGLRAAQLETSSNVPAGSAFTSAAGRTFAAPDTSGLRAAVKLLSPDQQAGTWTFDYSELSSQTSAYPGLMPVFADVPTSGLAAGDAARVAQLLDFAAGRGQTPGTANGQLPPGTLPLTSDNGLGDEAAYTRCVAKQVGAQSGVVPTLSGSCPAVPDTAQPGSGSSGGASGGTPGVVTGGNGSVVAAPPAAAPPGATAVSGSTVTTAEPMVTVGAYSRIGRFGLPSALVAGLLLVIAGLVLRWGAPAWALATVVGSRRGRRRR